jgi:O-antigen ligase
MLFLYGLYLKTGLLLLNIFEYGEFHSIRFGGLATDANFYAFLMSLAFLIGYYSTSKILNVKYKYIYMMIIGVNIIITISRSVMAILIVTFIFTSLFFEKKLKNKIRRLWIFLLFGLVFLYLATIPLPGLNISVYEWYALRATQNTPRFEMWRILLGDVKDQPLFGYGLRASEILLGGLGDYAHSSYIELLTDYGVIGFVIFVVGLMFNVFLKGMKLIKINSAYKGWIHSYMMICMLFGGFTLLYWPFLWTMFAVILGGYVNEKNRFNHNFV